MPASTKPDVHLRRSGQRSETDARGVGGTIVIEPRHRTWASEDALALLRELAISPVLADPPIVWDDKSSCTSPLYIRLHGSPEVYYSAYSDADIASYADMLGPESWCIFDNTASGAAIKNALTLADIIDGNR